MPNVLLAFDMNTAGPKNGEARQTFENELRSSGWTNEILVSGRFETLPETTLVADRTDSQARSDVVSAEAAAKKVEVRFEVTRHVLSAYRRIDSRSDRTRAGTTMAELLRSIGR